MATRSVFFFIVLWVSPWCLFAQSALSFNYRGDNILPVEEKAVHTEEEAKATSSVVLANKGLSTVLFKQYHHSNSLLLHLTKSRQWVSLQVTNAVGNVVQHSPKTTLAKGFYELPILNDHNKTGIYVVKIVIDDQAATFRTIQ